MHVCRYSAVGVWVLSQTLRNAWQGQAGAVMRQLSDHVEVSAAVAAAVKHWDAQQLSVVECDDLQIRWGF